MYSFHSSSLWLTTARLKCRTTFHCNLAGKWPQKYINGEGKKLSLLRPELVLGRGKVRIILESALQEFDYSVCVYLKINTMKS